MTELKQLPQKKPFGVNRATFVDGFNFGLGFWVAWLIIGFVAVPALTCAALLMAAMLGSEFMP